MPKSKRNKTVDLSKTKKHGLEGKKELYKKIRSNVENYIHIFVFAVNDMRNSKMKNVREQWKHSRFCIGKNKVMALALGRIPEEEYRPNLHKIGQMLVGERGLLFTNQTVDEVTKWFDSYSEADYARSGNMATEDVILPEGPLEQFPHNLESYLRQLGLPTTLKKGVIHLVKEYVVCREGDRLSPETARILKLLGYEMAEFRIKMLSVWSKDGSFVNLQSDSDPESKEKAVSPQKSFMRKDFELVEDCPLLVDDDEMEVNEVDSEKENSISNHSEKQTESKNDAEDPEEEIEVVEVVKLQTPKGKESLNKAKKNFENGEIIPCDVEEKQEPDQIKSNSKKKGKKSSIDAERNFGDSESIEIISCDLEENQEPEQVKSSSIKKEKKSFLETEKNSGDSDCIEIISSDLEKKPEQVKQNSKKNKAKSANKEKQAHVEEASENDLNSEEKVSNKSEINIKNSILTMHVETLDIEMEVDEIQEPEVKKSKTDSTIKKSVRKARNTVNKVAAKEKEEQVNDVKVSSKEEMVDTAAILKLTEKKLEESAEKPKKFSPKMTRARAAAANKKIKTPEPIETKRSTRKRKM